MNKANSLESMNVEEPMNVRLEKLEQIRRMHREEFRRIQFCESRTIAHEGSIYQPEVNPFVAMHEEMLKKERNAEKGEKGGLVAAMKKFSNGVAKKISK